MELINLFIICTATLLGLGIGSFINVVIFRVKSKEALTGRSHCVACDHQLPWYELIPVFSYLFLQGKCSQCKQDISVQYPVVEMSTAALFGIITVWYLTNPIVAIIYLIYTVFLIIIFVYDLKYYLILDVFTIPGIVLAIIGGVFLGLNWLSIALGMIIGGGFFFLQFVISKGKWIGGGDIRLGALMGAMLGWPNILVALFIAYLIGAVIAIGMMLQRKKGMKDTLPFGVFLTLATFITFLFGSDIVNWYLYEILKF